MARQTEGHTVTDTSSSAPSPAAMARRVGNDTATERAEAERQVMRIARLRLDAMLG